MGHECLGFIWFYACLSGTGIRPSPWPFYFWPPCCTSESSWHALGRVCVFNKNTSSLDPLFFHSLMWKHYFPCISSLLASLLSTDQWQQNQPTTQVCDGKSWLSAWQVIGAAHYGCLWGVSWEEETPQGLCYTNWINSLVVLKNDGITNRWWTVGGSRKEASH